MPGSPKKRERRERVKRAVELGLLAEGERIVPPSVEALLPPEETVFTARDLVALEKVAATGSPEEFQRASAMYFRRLLVRGLANVPVPKTVKEIQAIADMIRKSEGMDKPGGGGGVGLVGPRMVVRGAVRLASDVVKEAEVAPDSNESEPEPAPDSETPDSETPDSDEPEFTESVNDDFEV